MFTAAFEVSVMFAVMFNVQKEKLKVLEMFRKKIAGRDFHGFI